MICPGGSISQPDSVGAGREIAEDTLEAIQVAADKVSVSQRRCCECLGVDFSSQAVKLREKVGLPEVGLPEGVGLDCLGVVDGDRPQGVHGHILGGSPLREPGGDRPTVPVAHFSEFEF